MRRAGPLFRARPGGRDRENDMAKKITRRSKHSAMGAKAASQAKEHPHAKKTAQEVAPPAINSAETRGNLFPIVGVGASAGGLEAFTAFLKHLPSDSGMVFVLIQHLDPHQHSQLTELLSKATKMPVVEVSADVPIEPNHVYVIAPAVCLSMEDGPLIGFDGGVSADLHDRHLRRLGEQLRKLAVLVWVKVLNQHKHHAGIGRQVFEKSGERL